jgi:hypothetical protein
VNSKSAETFTAFQQKIYNNNSGGHAKPLDKSILSNSELERPPSLFAGIKSTKIHKSKPFN